MNKRADFYNKLIHVTGLLIGLPETGEDEDKALRGVLVVLTQLRDSYLTEQPEQSEQQSEGGQY